MANVVIPNASGVAGFEQGDSYQSVELFNSAIPLPVTEDFPVAQNSDLKAYSVVGLNGTGDLVLAKTSATAVVPTGVLVIAAKTGAGETARAPIYRAGNFNPAALTWHADYDTDAKKAAAFRDSPTPTNIVIRKRL